MQINEATVRKIAHLARVKVSDDEVNSLGNELNSILDWVDQLNEVTTEGVEPMTSAVDTVLKQRVDEVTDGGYVERITANAPMSEDDYFVVPKVVE